MVTYEAPMRVAIEQASIFKGATAPNPPVGAVGLNSQGKILVSAAHEKPGGLHAEARLIEKCSQMKILDQLHTVVVTLEPCPHIGKTPPCVDALISAKVKKIIIGYSVDPFPKVNGQGIKKLKSAGIEVVTGVLQKECKQLIDPYLKWIKTKRPWITIKRAFNQNQSMIPSNGKNTFTSEKSLSFAHQLRKRSDAIITGSETVLKDNPLFNVRYVKDHDDKKRWLVVMDRRKRVSNSWINAAEKRGFTVKLGENINEMLSFLGEKGVHEVLVESGPELSKSFIDHKLYDEDVLIEVQKNNAPDKITINKVNHVYRNH